MVVLSPEDITELLGINLSNTDCAGLKLTLDRVFSISGSGKLGSKVRDLPKYEPLECVNGWYHLRPGAYLIKYREYVKIPNGYIGLAIQRSSLLRMGVSLYTAVWDPGYEGRGSGLLVVHNPNGVSLERGVQVAQLVIIKMSRPTTRTYRGIYLGER